MKRIIFENIKFISFDDKYFAKILKINGLFVFPSAPGLASIDVEKQYYNSLKKSDLVFLDSGLFVLLLKFFKKINSKRFSGYKFLKFFFKFLKKNKKLSVFLIDPKISYSKNNFKFINKIGIKKNNINQYIAPLYNPNNLKDKNLLKKINKLKPKIILINIGGGTQEVLGLYLKKNLNHKCKIICTGAAISFFTKDQAPINDFIDKYYLGWLIRLILNPLTFYKRDIYTLKLIKIVFLGKAYEK